MIGNPQPYPKYRDSGQAWIGKLPQHWPVLPNRAVFEEVNDRNHADESMLSVTIAKGVTSQQSLLSSSSKKDSSRLDKSAYKLVQPQDLAYNKMRAWQGAVGISALRGIISPAYVVMRLREPQEPRFFHHLYRTPHFAKEAERWSYGITSDMWSLRPQHFKMINTPLPPPDERTAIVSYLDHMDRRINAYIRAKRRLIALLNEEKQAIICHAVTRGLNPNTKVKPSGVPWLGEIPEHWEVRRLCSIVHRIDQGVSPQASGLLADDASWGVLKSGCVNHGIFRETEHKRLDKGFEIDPGIVVRVGDVLISRACGSPHLVGSVGKVESLHYRLILSDKTFRPVFRNGVDTDFVVYAMNSPYYRCQVEQAISGAQGLANNLPLSELKTFYLALPPQEEARRVTAYLRATLQSFNAAISHAEREILLIREYRTRLIADVVTGQLDVREALSACDAQAGAAKLPDEMAVGEMAEPEPIDEEIEEDALAALTE